MSDDEAKRRAAIAALDLLPGAGVLGLGTGSTTRFFIEAVGQLVREGRRFSCVPTSQQSRALATLLLSVPGLSAIARVQNQAQLTDGPAMLGIVEVESIQRQWLAGVLHAPGLAAVGAVQQD